MTKSEAKRAGWNVLEPDLTIMGHLKECREEKYFAAAILRIDKVKTAFSAYGRTKLQASTRLLVAIEQYEKHMPPAWRASAKAEGRG